MPRDITIKGESGRRMAVPSYYVSDLFTEGWCEPLARIGKDVIGVVRCGNPKNLGYN